MQKNENCTGITKQPVAYTAYNLMLPPSDAMR